jgi:hypothetical protein
LYRARLAGEHHQGETMKKILIALAAVGALATGNAFAQGYVTGAIGQSKIDVDCDGLASCDDSDAAWKIIGGFKFHPNLAGELTYFDFGKVTASVVPGADVEIKTRGIGLGIAGMMDFTPQWSGVARLGVVSNRVKTSSNFGLSGSERKAEAYVGLGVGYAFNPQLKLDAAWDFTKARAEAQGGGVVLSDKADVNLFTLGLTYSF